jgi:hypothetical protein
MVKDIGFVCGIVMLIVSIDIAYLGILRGKMFYCANPANQRHSSYLQGHDKKERNNPEQNLHYFIY